MLARKIERAPGASRPNQQHPAAREERTSGGDTLEKAGIPKQTVTRFLICVVLGVSLALLLTWRFSMIHSLGYEISAAEQQLAALENQEARYAVALAEKSRPQRIETIAQAELGMVYPDPGEVRSLPGGIPLPDVQMASFDGVQPEPATEDGLQTGLMERLSATVFSLITGEDTVFAHQDP